MPKEVDLNEEWSSTRISVFMQVTGYTIGMIAITAGGGYYLDQYLDTFPTLFIIGLVVGFPLTQLLIFKKIKKYTQTKAK